MSIRQLFARRPYSRRKASTRRVSAEALEIRTLPAGVVGVHLVGNHVVIIGDGSNNNIDVFISPGGISVEGIGTSVSFDGVLNAPGVEVPIGLLSGAASVSINMNAGNDIVAAHFSGDVTLVSLAVILGRGNDVFETDQVEDEFDVEDQADVMITGDFTIDAGAGNDVVDIDWTGRGEVEVGGKFDVDLERGNDEFDLRATDFTVNGEAQIDGGAGNDDIQFHNEGEITFESHLTIDGAGGADVIDLHSDDDFSRLSVGGNLRIDGANLSNVSDKNDRVVLRENTLDIDGDLVIETRNGADDVEVIALGDYGAMPWRVGGQLRIDTGTDNDRITFVTYGDLHVVGDLRLESGIGHDEVSLFAGGELIVDRNLIVDTGANNDHAQIFSVFGSEIGVGGDFHAMLGDGNDCLLAGSFGEFGFSVAGDVKIDGDASRRGGNDLIALGGVSIMRDLNLNAGDGKNIVLVFGFLVGRDATIETGRGNDVVVAEAGLIVGNTVLRTGSGVDRVLVDELVLGPSVLVDLGNGNDQIGIGEIEIEEDSTVVIDGGFGKDAFDSGTPLPAGVVKNFETDLDNEVDEVDGEFIFDLVEVALDRCFDEFSVNVEDFFGGE